MSFFRNTCEIRNYLSLLILIFTFELAAQETPRGDMSLIKNHADAEIEWLPCPEFMPNGCGIAILNGNPEERNSDIFFKVPANSVIPNHRHTSAERMLLVTGELEVTYEGEESQIMKAGSYGFGPAQKPHSARCGGTPCVLFIAFEEPLDAIAVEEKN